MHLQSRCFLSLLSNLDNTVLRSHIHTFDIVSSFRRLHLLSVAFFKCCGQLKPGSGSQLRKSAVEFLPFSLSTDRVVGSA